MTRAEATVRGYLGESVVDDILVVHWPRPSLLARVRAGYALRHDALDWLAEELGGRLTAHVEADGVRWVGVANLPEAQLESAGADPWPYPEELEAFTQMS